MKGFKTFTAIGNLHCLVYIILAQNFVYISSIDVASLNFDTFDKPSRTCEPIMVDMCTDQLGYNTTGAFTMLNGESYTQQDSLILLRTYQHFIMYGCSKQLKPFLCASYVPMCDPQVKQLIGPCRSVCENVKVS